ncbi:hypothetical protein FACS1894199_00500 [Bacteroidia bacterium]|nr:hypothetical protein FACS1894199_00500 [Bacteroidia bacterium]
MKKTCLVATLSFTVCTSILFTGISKPILGQEIEREVAEKQSEIAVIEKQNITAVTKKQNITAVAEKQDTTAVTEGKKGITKSIAFLDGSVYDLTLSWRPKQEEEGSWRATESHWGGFGFTFLELDGLKDAKLNYGKSYSINWNLFDWNVALSPHWLFVSGFGFDWSRFTFKGNTGLWEYNDGSAQFVKDEQDRNYATNKLGLFYLTVPILFEYQVRAGEHNVFFVNGGVEGIIKGYGHSKLEIRQLTDGTEYHKFKNLNIRPINARICLRAGFNSFSIFGYYQPLSMFATGEGPEVYPCGIGLMWHY